MPKKIPKKSVTKKKPAIDLEGEPDEAALSVDVIEAEDVDLDDIDLDDPSAAEKNDL